MVGPNQLSQAWREIAGDVVVSFVDAVNDFDASRLIDLFALDAHVNDQLRDFWGKARIGEWIRREIVGERFRMDVLHAKRHFGDSILSAKVSGDFDKTGLPDPLILNFLFSLCDGEIVRLFILVPRPSDAEPDVRIGGG
jgi:hypothetical protein